MALPLRRLTGLIILAASFGCPKAVTAPTAVIAAVGTGVQIGQVIRLDGTASNDTQGRDLSYAWQFTQIPVGSTTALNDAHSATPSFLADVDGVYGVQLVVSNAFLSSAAATTSITVSKCGGRAPVFGNAAVTAKDAQNASITNNFAVGATITLSSDVSDPDNSTTDSVCTAAQNQAVSYLWKLVGQPAASAATLNNATASSPSFVADVAGTYTVRLVATDSTGRSTPPQDQTFTVSSCGANAPTVSTVAPVTEQKAVGVTVQLTATPADADNSAACQAVLPGPQTFSYQWSLPVLPNGSRAALNSPNAQNPSFTPDIDGLYVVRLVVTDSTGRSSAPFDTPSSGANALTIPKCGNNAPVVAITGPTTGYIGALLQFGQTLSDPDGPVNGGAAPAIPACSPVIPQSVSLHWSILALPPGSQAALNNPSGTNPSFIPDVDGTYTLQLVATDQGGLSSAPSTQSVTVAKCGKNPPSISFTPPASTLFNAGSAVALTANVTNNDAACIAGETYSYDWSLASKPANSNAFTTAAAPSGNSDTASFTADVPNGTYQVKLVVTSSAGISSVPAFFSFNTNGCGTNAPAIVTGTTGADKASPNVGFDTVTLTAHGSDSDNGAACSPALAQPQALSYQWSLVSRPSGSGAALDVAATDGSVATFKPDVIGPYQFSVVVTDSAGLRSPPTFVTVSTSQCGANAPKITSATATSAPNPPRPTLDAVALAGTVQDNDDSIAGCFPGGQKQTYAWSVVSRPAGSSAVIGNATTLAASFTPDVPGDYQFRLDVTDSLGLSAAPAFASITASSCSLGAPKVDPYVAQTGTQFGSFPFPAPSINSAGNTNCLASSTQFGYVWAVVAAPAGSSATLSNPAVAAPLFTPDRAGDYQFSLVVTNTQGIAAPPVFLNLHANGCSAAAPNNALNWASIGVTQVVDHDLGTFNTGPLLNAPHVGSQVQVNAVASEPPANAACAGHTGPFSYQWAIVAAPSGSHATLTSTTDLFPSFVPDVQGAYQLSVVATDALGNTSAAPDFVSITTSSCGANVPRVAINPADLSLAAGGILSMTPTTLSVAAGFPQNDDTALCPARFHVAPGAYTYSWSISTQPPSGRATLTNASSASTSFTAFVAGDYQAHLVATTPAGISSDPNAAASFVSIHAKTCGSTAPIVSSVSTFAHGTTNVLSRPRAGLDSVDLVANATDPDSACGDGAALVTQYTWDAVSLPSGSGQPTHVVSATPTFQLSPDVAGAYVYSVVATDDTLLQSAPVQITINTAACAPSFAGVRATGPSGLLTPTSANAVSSATFDALTLDIDALQLDDKCVQQPRFAYAWSLTQKPADSQATLSSLSNTSTSVTPDVPGIYVAQLVITDNAGLSSDPATLTLDIANCGSVKPAIASLSPSAAHTPPNAGDLVTMAAVNISDANVGSCAAANRYTGNGVVSAFATSLANPSVFVNGTLKSAPADYTVSGGQVHFVSVPPPGAAIAFSTITFSYRWSLISIPGGSSSQLSSTSSASPQFVTDLPNGTYQVALSVTDSLGNVSDPQFRPVTSSPCGANPPAFSPALPNLGGNANTPIAISWTTTDADTGGACGLATSITSVAWSIVSAPAGSHASLTSSVTAGGANSPGVTNSFRADMQGTYVVQATAFSSNGLSTSQTFQVAVSGCGTHAPSITNLAVSDAGGPVSRPPVPDAVTVTASHVDADEGGPCGDTQTYAFTLVSTPAGSSAIVTHTLATDNHASINVDRAGEYVVSVVATDSFGLSSEASQVTIATGSCGPSLSAAPAGFGVTQGATVGPASALNVSASILSDNCVAGVPGAGTLAARIADNTIHAAWSFISRPSGSGAVISGAATGAPVFITDAAGAYALQLVLSDNGGFSTVYTATVTASACATGPQIINTSGAGGLPLSGANMFLATDVDPSGTTTSSANIFSGDRVQLSLPTPTATVGGLVAGACSAALGYEWSLIARPAGSSATLSSTSASSPAFVADAPGNYQFAVVVRDGLGNPSSVVSGAAPGTSSITPFFFNVTVSDCGSRAPTLGGTLTADPAARANLAFDVVASQAAADPNNPGVRGAGPADAFCPTRFHHGTFTYAFSVTQQPAGAQGVFSATAAPLTQKLLVKQGGANAFKAQVIATADSGLSSAPLSTPLFSVSNCGANPPVANTFDLSQSIPNDGGANPAENVAGNGSATTGFYFGFPVTIVANVTDADTGGACNLPAQNRTYTWSLVSAPPASRLAIGGPNTGSLVFTPDVADASNPYKLSLTTTDDQGDSSTSTVSFNVSCGTSSPTATALKANSLLSPATVAVGAPVGLDATTDDTDHSAPGTCSASELQPLAYHWEFTHVPAGSAATLLAADTLKASFVPDVASSYDLKLTVTDPQGNSGSGVITVNATCGAVAPSVALVAGSSARDFTVSQALSVNGGSNVTLTHAGNHLLNSVANPLYPGVPAQLSAVVLGAPGHPIVDPLGICPDVTDTSITYRWSIIAQPAGSTAVINNPAAASPSFTPDVTGVYDFALTVTDQNGRSSLNVLTVDDTATGSPPFPNATHPGFTGTCGTKPPTVVLQNPGAGPIGVRVQLDATGSQSPDDFRSLVGAITQTFPAGGCGLDLPLAYQWNLTAAPPGSLAQIDNPTLVDPSFVPDKDGLYTIQLTATDGRNHTTRTSTFSASTPSNPNFNASSTVFTATASDPTTGNPVVAWWDNATGTVSASRCTAGCTTPTPTWQSLGDVDTGLTPMVFAFNEEPRPIAIATSGSSTYVAYYTARSVSGSTGAHGLAACGLGLAVHDGTSWVSWTNVLNFQGVNGSGACSQTSLPPYTFFELGRWVSMTMNGALPVIAFWNVMGPQQYEPEVTNCSTAACTSFTGTTRIDISGGSNRFLGKWVSLVSDTGFVRATYYQDNDGAGNKGLRYASNSSGSFLQTNVEPLSNVVDVGRFSSIALLPPTGTNGLGVKNLAIVYNDTTTTGANFAKLATCSTVGSCTNPGAWGAPAQIADPLTTNYGRDTSIVVDANGLPRVAYFDIENIQVRLLTGASLAPYTLSRVTDFASVASPVGLSLAFSPVSLQEFMSFSTFNGLQVFAQ